MTTGKKITAGVTAAGLALSGIVVAPSAAAFPTSSLGSSDSNQTRYADRNDVRFKASNGVTSTYHVYASHVDRNKPAGALFWFHGDGAYEYDRPNDPAYIGGDDGILETAKKHNMVLIVPKTPDKRTSTWWEDWQKNPDYVRDLYSEILTKYDVDKSNVWNTGFSGGAEFTGYHFLPWVLEDTGVTGGGAVMFGAAARPTSTRIPFASPVMLVITR